jgi:clan AA aspartic protease
MIRGHVTRAYEAVVTIRVVGAGGRSKDVAATVDTGFTGELTLPAAVVAELELAFLQDSHAFLANEMRVDIPVYRAVVEWDGVEREVLVDCMAGTPLIGMHLLHEHLLSVQVVRDGQVTIQALG